MKHQPLGKLAGRKKPKQLLLDPWDGDRKARGMVDSHRCCIAADPTRLPDLRLVSQDRDGVEI
jgi:hypothetical protein